MSLNLKDAYFHIQVAPHHRRFLRFAFEWMACQYKVLPFGLSLAPRTFTRCMDAALSPLQQMGIRILNYLNDWLILAQLQVVLTSHKTLLLSHLGCQEHTVTQPVSFVPGHSYAIVSDDSNCLSGIQRHAGSFEEGTARLLKAFQRILGLMATASPVLRLGLLHM